MTTVDMKVDDLSTRMIEHFGALSDESRKRLLRAMEGLTADLLARAQSAAPRRTGRLASHFYSSVKSFEHRVVGKVGNESAWAGATEFGFHGSEQVRGYTRQVSTIFGKMVSPVSVAVAGFTRMQNIAAHPFLRPALAEMESEITDKLQAAYEGLDA